MMRMGFPSAIGTDPVIEVGAILARNRLQAGSYLNHRNCTDSREEAYPTSSSRLRRPGSLSVSRVLRRGGVRFDSATRARLASHGVAADAVDDFALGHPRHPGALALGYGHLSLAEIDDGARRLAAAIGQS